MKQRKKIVMIASKTYAHINFRGDLTQMIYEKGYDITVIVPTPGLEEEYQKIGAKQIVMTYNKNTTSIFKNLTYIQKLKKIIKEESPDIVFGYTIKPVILGSIAAKLAGVNRIYSMVTGLGHVYSDNSLKTKIIRFICGIGYKLAFKLNDKVIFQNQDDIDEVVRRRYIKKEKCKLVNGSGVNMEKFKRNKLPEKDVFLMVSRVLKEKGVIEYFEAAEKVKQCYPQTKFMFLGEIDKTNYAIDSEHLQDYIDKGIVEVIPQTDDVPKVLEKCRYFVLPTYYREGIPRSLLEALSMGRPIITTKMPGCKETINGKNGLFTNIKDVDDLKQKMIWMIEHPNKVEKMSDESYKLCAQKFEISLINKDMLRIMEIK